MVARHPRRGEELMKSRSLADNIDFFRDMFEVGRRYKCMNPSKMRDSYGKLMFMLQDTETHLVKRETQLSFVKASIHIHTHTYIYTPLSLMHVTHHTHACYSLFTLLLRTFASLYQC
jgi:hypothetical protein